MSGGNSVQLQRATILKVKHWKLRKMKRRTNFDSGDLEMPVEKVRCGLSLEG